MKRLFNSTILSLFLVISVSTFAFATDFPVSVEVLTDKQMYIAGETIYLHIQSRGGFLFHCWSGMDAILNCKVPVVTVVDGYAGLRQGSPHECACRQNGPTGADR